MVVDYARAYCELLTQHIHKAQHRDGAEMLKLMAYVQSIVTFRPGAAAIIADVHPVARSRADARARSEPLSHDNDADPRAVSMRVAPAAHHDITLQYLST